MFACHKEQVRLTAMFQLHLERSTYRYPQIV